MRQVLKLSILIVDDHLLIRLGLKQVRGQEFRDVVFGEAETAAEALTQIKARPWRLVILDVGLPDDDDGFSVLQEVCARRPQAAVLVLGMPPDSQYAARSLQLGASGYISKSSGRSDLLKAVSNVLDGKKDFSESDRRGVRSQRSAALHEDLSAQEYKVLCQTSVDLATNSMLSTGLFESPSSWAVATPCKTKVAAAPIKIATARLPNRYGMRIAPRDLIGWMRPIL